MLNFYMWTFFKCCFLFWVFPAADLRLRAALLKEGKTICVLMLSDDAVHTAFMLLSHVVFKCAFTPTVTEKMLELALKCAFAASQNSKRLSVCYKTSTPQHQSSLCPQSIWP